MAHRWEVLFWMNDFIAPLRLIQRPSTKLFSTQYSSRWEGMLYIDLNRIITSHTIFYGILFVQEFFTHLYSNSLDRQYRLRMKTKLSLQSIVMAVYVPQAFRRTKTGHYFGLKNDYYWGTLYIKRYFAEPHFKYPWYIRVYYTVHSTQYTVHIQYPVYILHSIQYTVYILHSIQYTVHSIQYTVHSIQYTVHSIQYTVHSIHITHL